MQDGISREARGGTAFRKSKVLLAAIVSLLMVASLSFSQAWGYFNFGQVRVSMGASSVTVQAGASTSVSVSATPYSDDQTLGCGSAGCPQTCEIPGSYDGSCFDANGQCKCAGYDYSTYYTTLSASSSNSGVASAYVNGGTLYVTGNAPGVATITVTGQLRQWTSGSSTMQVSVTVPPQQSETPSGGSTSDGSHSSSGSSSGNASSSGSSSSGSSQSDVVNAAGIPQEAQASESRSDALNEEVVETTAGKFYTVELNSHCSVADELAKIVGTSDHMTFWYGNTSDQPAYSWMFNGEDIPEDANLDVDLSITVSKLGTGDVANLMDQAEDGVVMEFAHDGDLPAPAEVYIDVSEVYADGTSLSLYCYDEATHEFVHDRDDVSVDLNYASFSIDHCSTWALSTDDLSSYRVEEANTPLAAALSDESPEMAQEPGVDPVLVAGIIVAVVLVAGAVALGIRMRRRAKMRSCEAVEDGSDSPADEQIDPEGNDQGVSDDGSAEVKRDELADDGREGEDPSR